MSVRPQTKDKPTRVSFQWDDPFLLEDQLTEDERMIRDTAHAFAQEKLLPRVAEAYADETADRKIFQEMGELGLIGLTLPEDYGCANASYVAYGLVAREIERVDSGYRSMNSVQSSAQEVSAEAGDWGMGGVLRLDRVGCRLRCREHEDPRGEGGGRLSADRLQNVDFELADRRCLRGLGEVGGA
jgi:hypothetical protein